MKNILEIEKNTSTKFKNKELLTQAFTHRSYLNEHSKSGLEHNERLEFLGDAVLELVVTEYLYKNFPNPEGELTNWRSALVKGETISKIARDLGFNDFILLSRGEAKAEGKARNLILANCFEAFVGALYLDNGYTEAQKFIQRNLIIKLSEIIEKGLHIDSKSKFQEIAQEKTGITPRYEVIKEEGPDHEKVFVIGCYLESEKMGQGVGRSKQEAEQQAARAALVKIEKTTKSLKKK